MLLNFNLECASIVHAYFVKLLLISNVLHQTGFRHPDVDDTGHVMSLARWPNLAVKIKNKT